MGFDIPQSLKQAITNKTCIPFVGAGLSLTLLRKGSNERLFCNWNELLQGASEQLKQEHKLNAATAIDSALNYIEADSYHRAANIAKKELGTKAFNRYLKATFDKDEDDIEPTSLATAKLVWQLNSQLVITTNYDKVLEHQSV